jgi:hypothetical protein
MKLSKHGWQVLHDLHAAAATRAIPVILLTIVDKKTLGDQLGAAGYILNPFDDVLLRACISANAEKKKYCDTWRRPRSERSTGQPDRHFQYMTVDIGSEGRNEVKNSRGCLLRVSRPPKRDHLQQAAAQLLWDAQRNLGVTPFIRSASLLGVVIGVASVVTLMALGAGTTSNITSRIQYICTNLLTIQNGQPGGAGGPPSGPGSGITSENLNSLTLKGGSFFSQAQNKSGAAFIVLGSTLAKD